MNYGIELYDNNNKLIFSSEKNPIQILSTGSITVNEMGDESVETFPETENKPKIWVDNGGYYRVKPSAGEFSYVINICYKNIEKNANGNYSSFTIGAYEVGTIPIREDAGYAFPWTVNYIVFV